MNSHLIAKKAHLNKISLGPFLIAFLFIFLSSYSWSQNTITIKGSVKDSTGTPLSFGNFILLNQADSSVLKGIDIWDGKFELGGVEKEKVILKIAAVGYDDFYQNRDLTTLGDSLLDLGDLVIQQSNKELNTVDVVYIKPMFERKPGKLIVNVEETMLSDKGTIKDLLRSTPNVIVKSSGAVEVVGRGSAIIYLDGQRIMSIDMLSSISSNDVSKIEVIENPSARYDAEGNAVIEITTISGSYDGYEGSIGLRGMKRTESQMAYWGQFHYQKKWFSMYLGAGQYAGRLYEDESYHREVFGSPSVTLENDVLRVVNHQFDSWLWADTDYRLDSVNTLFLNYTGSREKYETRVDNSNEVFEDGVYVGQLNSETVDNPFQMMHSISGGYVRKLDTLDSDFRLAGQFTNFDSQSRGDIEQFSSVGASTTSFFRSNSSNDIQVFMGQADWTKNYNDRFNMAIGAKNSYVTNKSGIDLKYQFNEDWLTDSSYFNQFDYYENVSAAYLEFEGTLKKFSYSTGLRYEYTRALGDSYTSGVGAVNRNYHNLFPNVQLSYDFTPDLVMGLAYNNRIQRPKYQDLDPFIEFIDSLTSFRGNPNLLPAISHKTEVNLVYMEYASLSFSYTRTQNPMHLSVVQNPGTNTFSAVVQNIKSQDLYTIGVVLPYELSWWTTFNVFGYTFNNYSIQDGVDIVVNDKPTLYVSLYNEFRIPKVCNIELNYEYTAPGAQGFFTLLPYQYFGGSISRKFLKDKLTARFSVFDLFIQTIERGESTLANFNVSYSSWEDTRSFMLTLIWDFGKLRERSMTEMYIDEDEQERLED